MSELLFGWYSHAKAKYIGVDVYQETDIQKNGRILQRGRRLIVTDVVAGPQRFVNNGDEVFVATLLPKDFVEHIPAAAASGRRYGGPPPI
jgi:hypothetical protein